MSERFRWIPAAAPLGLALITALPAPPPASAAETAAKDDPAPAAFHLQVRGDDGDNVDLRLSSGWLGAIVSAATLECDGDADRDARRMMESLRDQGEGGVWKDRDRDGDRVLARRAKGQLKIETTDEEGERAFLEMPWELAECLMLGISPPGDLGRRIASGEAKFRVEVAGRDGGTVRMAIE